MRTKKARRAKKTKNRRSLLVWFMYLVVAIIFGVYLISNAGNTGGTETEQASANVFANEVVNNVAEVGKTEIVEVGVTETEVKPLPKSHHIKNVPYINQYSTGYPTGCEAAATAMVARYYGYDNVTTGKIVKKTPTDKEGKRYTTINGVTGWYAKSPFEVFVGDPSGTRLGDDSYGCFAPPIVVALEKLKVNCTNISGCSEEELFRYVSEDTPVIVWGTVYERAVTKGITWQYLDGSGSFTELLVEHCLVLIGYDKDKVYLNDPAIGKNVSQTKKKFVKTWKKMYSQAIIINEK